MTDDNKDEDIILSSSLATDQPTEDEPVISTNDEDRDPDADALEEDDTIAVDSSDIDRGNAPDTSNSVSFPEDIIDLRGEMPAHLIELLKATEDKVGARELDSLVRTPGSWANLVFRAVTDPSEEEARQQEALGQLSDADKAGLSHKLVQDGKVLLRTSSLLEKLVPGKATNLTGDAAMLAFQCSEKGGGYRIPLYNSGITIDVIVPTGNDIQTMISNCLMVDKQLGSSDGAHYFAYSDLMYKTQILNFIQPLIVNSSYVDWRKRDKLWSIVKLPDLAPLVLTLAALCYKDGFDGFVVKCTRPVSEDHPTGCTHTETFKANLFEMVVTRFPSMSADAIKFVTSARTTNVKNTVAQIAQYQADLGFEGERIQVGDRVFTMQIPTIAEHVEAGGQFIADIINEIEGDNTEGRYQQFGFRYIRTFVPWIATVEIIGEDGVTLATTADRKVISRELEKIDDKDEEGSFRDRLRGYINKVQLTYVGYPCTPCTVCGYTADTASGMRTFDPFSAFFTLAFLYLTPQE